MATPMTANQFVQALRNEGVYLIEHPGWRTHNREGHGGWGPMNGVMIHHTGGSAPSDGEVVWSGRAGLPGPLCHTYLPKTGVAKMIGNGRANHAGGGDPAVLAAVINEDPLPKPHYGEGDPGAADGNAHFYGLEISNLGTEADTYPDKQYDAAVRWAAAICRFHIWSEKSVIGHKEWSDQKPDPSFSMLIFRLHVAERLAHQASWNPEENPVALTEADIQKIALAVWAYKNTKAGDKHDAHQALANIEVNSAKAVSPTIDYVKLAAELIKQLKG